MDPLGALEAHFGFGAFRPGQEEVVASILEGRDTLAIMPTGRGKSLCYQLPAMLLEGVTVVVSPLIALMKDQVDALTRRGLPATLINSTLSLEEQRARMEGLEAGAYRLVYIAPERFRHRRFVEALGRVRLALFAIDEAHCLSQWGHDFRPDYLRLGEAINRLERPTVAAFTATATPLVREDIVRHLHLREPQVFVSGFARPNLSFCVTATSRKAEKLARLSRLVEAHKTGIVYCATRKRVEELTTHLAEWEVPYVAYHGGLGDDERHAAQERFLSGQAEVAVATNAFGMGIDRPDLRFVAHYEMPGSVEALYQEAGRAGRDGEPAVCELLFNHADRRVQEFFIEGANPGEGTIRQLYDTLRSLAEEGEGDEVRMSIDDLTERLGLKNGMAVSSALSFLSRSRVIERFDIPGMRIRGTRIVDIQRKGSDLELDGAALAEKERRDFDKLDAVIAYATAIECRQGWILRYFGEEMGEPCGICDACAKGRSGKERVGDEEELLTLQKLLSGVARASWRRAEGRWEGRFGKNMILDMLLGSERGKVIEAGLHKLSTYGLLKELGRDYVSDLIDECRRMGLVISSGGPRPLLTLTGPGAEAMRREREPKLIWPTKGGSKSGSKKVADGQNSKASTEAGEALSLSGGPLDEDLLEQLKKKRLQLAKIRGDVKPFQIFANRTLEALASVQPLTVEEAMELPGIGPRRAKTVLKPFLKIIAEHRAGK